MKQTFEEMTKERIPFVYVVNTRPYLEVHVTKNGYRARKVFPYKNYSTKEEALEAAILYKDEHLKMALKYSRTIAAPGNSAWDSLSKKPKPRPTSQILFWTSKKEGE